MNKVQLIRQIKRIPRLAFHIKRCADDPERVAAFKEELERREAEMVAAGKKELLKKLQAIQLSPLFDDEAKKLQDILADES